MRPPVKRRARVVGAAGLLAPLLALGYGAQGHLIAGRVAAGYLCHAAAAEIAQIADGEGLDRIGLWADRARGRPAFEHTAPWHYMNIPDTVPIAAYRSPPEGDVLTAIDRAYRVLAADPLPPDDERLEALRFLTHFIVDLHQPLHVGRADDRGGNAVEIVVDGKRIDLHRFWDTEAITTTGRGIAAYARAAADDVTADSLAEAFDPRAWAAEALELRGAVYAFPGEGKVIGEAYLSAAQRITQSRLTLAGARLAGTLNSLFCG